MQVQKPLGKAKQEEKKTLSRKELANEKYSLETKGNN